MVPASAPMRLPGGVFGRYRGVVPSAHSGLMETTEIPSGSILVGVDGSSSAARALEWAIDQAVLERRPLTLVHGAGPSMWYADSVGLDQRLVVEAIRDEAYAVLRAARDQVTARAPQLELHERLQMGDARSVLIELSSDAAMIVLGSRGRGPVKSLLLGSVAVAVTSHAKCPVVVLRPRNVGAVRRGILVGADGTERSSTTLEFAYQQASLRGLPLTVMHCFWDVRSATIGPGIVPDDEPDLEVKRALLAESISGMTEKFPDVQVRKVLARGLTDKCLVAAAETMDMVVVGARERGSLSGIVYGSVAAAVVEHASSIVVVVPHTAKH